MLTDDQWSVLEPLFQKERTGAGRPQIHSDREVLNGVLWVLRTGAAWADLPDRFPSSATCYRRFSKWVKDGRLRKILESLARHLEDNGLINLEECFIDGTFVVAKKGAQKWERPSGAKVRSSWLLLTLLVYLSPCTRILLTLMKSDLSRLQSMKLSRWDDPEELLGIVPMTVMQYWNRHGNKRWKWLFPPENADVISASMTPMCTRSVIWLNVFLQSSSHFGELQRAMTNLPRPFGRTS